MNNDSPSTTAQPGWSLRELVQITPTAALGATAVCFATGLLIVNLRLAKYGVYSAEFVRTEYVLAGGTFILLVAVAYISWVYGIKEIKQSGEKWREKKRLSAVGYVVFGVIGTLAPVIFVFSVVSQYKFGVDNWRMWASVLILVATGQYASELFLRLFGLWQVISTTEGVSTKIDQLSRFRDLLGLVPLLLVSLGSYAHLAYPYISPAMGGGRKDPVVLIATSRGFEVSAAIGLPVQTDGRSVGPLQLLTESEAEIVVLLGDEDSGPLRAMRLRRTMFDAVLTPSTNK